MYLNNLEIKVVLIFRKYTLKIKLFRNRQIDDARMFLELYHYNLTLFLKIVSN